jgi:hypothetical protein
MTYKESIRQDLRYKNGMELQRMKNGRIDDSSLAGFVEENPQFQPVVQDMAQERLNIREQERIAAAAQQEEELRRRAEEDK